LLEYFLLCTKKESSGFGGFNTGYEKSELEVKIKKLIVEEATVIRDVKNIISSLQKMTTTDFGAEKEGELKDE
jgi:hypothetical protein